MVIGGLLGAPGAGGPGGQGCATLSSTRARQAQWEPRDTEAAERLSGDPLQGVRTEAGGQG